MIYTVKRGDTLFKIAQTYGVPAELIVDANGLTRPNDLAIGQNLLLPNPQQNKYTVRRGDTLYNIARNYNLSLNDLITANPQISNPNRINIGDEINIPDTRPLIEVNGYAIPNIRMETLNRTLPYLTYLSLFSYQIKSDGSLTGLYEESLISTARNAKVAPVMVVTNINSNGGFDSALASSILNNTQIQDVLINNIISTLTAKNYYGVDIDFEYLYANDREAYISFLTRLKAELNKINKYLSVAVAPKYRDNQQGILYEAHDYATIGRIADRVIIMTYEWGYVYGEPMAISPLSEVEAVIRYAVTRIPSNKILMGMPNYAYDWKLPWAEGNVAETLTNTQALERAITNGATIQFDQRAQAPYFNYVDANGVSHVVWFDDARSIQSRLNLVTKYNLAGISYWTINNFSAVNYSVLDSMFRVKKVL